MGAGGAETVMLMVSSSLSGGMPSSVTLMVRLKVPVVPGVHVNSPLVASILAPDSGFPRLKVRLLPSKSVAVAVKLKVSPKLTVWLLMANKAGAWLEDVTVVVSVLLLLAVFGSLIEELTVAVLLSVPLVLAKTVTVMGLAVAPAASVAKSQVTVLPLWLQVQSVPVALIKPTLGNVSTICT